MEAILPREKSSHKKKTRNNNSKSRSTQHFKDNKKTTLMESTSLTYDKQPVAVNCRQQKAGILSPQPPQTAENSAPTIIQETIPSLTVIKMECLSVGGPQTGAARKVDVEDGLLEPVTINAGIYGQQQTKRKSRFHRFRHFVGKRIFSCINPRTHS